MVKDGLNKNMKITLKNIDGKLRNPKSNPRVKDGLDLLQ